MWPIILTTCCILIFFSAVATCVISSACWVQWVMKMACWMITLLPSKQWIMFRSSYIQTNRRWMTGVQEENHENHENHEWRPLRERWQMESLCVLMRDVIWQRVTVRREETVAIQFVLISFQFLSLKELMSSRQLQMQWDKQEDKWRLIERQSVVLNSESFCCCCCCCK